MLEDEILFSVSGTHAADGALHTLRDNNVRSREPTRKTCSMNGGVLPRPSLDTWQYQSLERISGQIGITYNDRRSRRLIIFVVDPIWLRGFDSLADDPVGGTVVFLAAQFLKLTHERIESGQAAQVLQELLIR